MKYIAACLFLLAGNEILSLMVLMVMMGMFFFDIARARLSDGETTPHRCAELPLRRGAYKEGRYE